MPRVNVDRSVRLATPINVWDTLGIGGAFDSFEWELPAVVLYNLNCIPTFFDFLVLEVLSRFIVL